MSLAALLLWAAAAAPLDTGFVDAARLAGEARAVGRSGGFASPGSLMALDIDPGVVIPGDRLVLFESAEEGSQGAGGLFRHVGSVTVVADGPEGIKGVVNAAARELSGRLRLGFSLPMEIQLTEYLPFLGSVARAYLADPAGAPLVVAVMDVTNPQGGRTIAGDRLRDGVERALCARRQFACVARARVEGFMREQGAATSRALDGAALLDLRARLAVDVMITGHYRALEEQGKVEYALRAVALKPGVAPPALWRGGQLTAEQWGGQDGEQVTVEFQPLRRARITVKALDAGAVEGIKARRVATARIAEMYPGRDVDDQPFAPAALALTVGGRAVDLPGPGATYSGLIPAGEVTVAVEYLPRPLDGRMEAGPPPRPLSEKLTARIGEGEELIVTVVSREERGYAILAMNYSRVREKTAASGARNADAR